MSKSQDTIKGSEVIASTLADAEIKTIFTLAGGHFLPTYEAIGSQKRIEIIAARHELGQVTWRQVTLWPPGKQALCFLVHQDQGQRTL